MLEGYSAGRNSLIFCERILRMNIANTDFENMRRNLARLVSGSVLSQVLLLAATPFLTRIFNPDAFGVLAVFSATYAIAIPLTTLKYDAALILPKSAQSAVGITVLVFIIATSLAILSGLLLWVCAQLWWPYAESLNLWLPVAIWLGAMYTLMQQWSARRNDYQHFARSQVIGALLNIGTSLSLGILLGGKPDYLVAGFVCGMGGSLAYMFWNHYPRPFFTTHGVQLSRLHKRAKVYRQFPGLVLPATLLMSVGQNSIPLILTTNYSIADIGQFGLANRLLLVPAALIGGALSEAFRAELVKRLRERSEIARLMSTTLVTMLLFVILLFGILSVAAPILFSLVFGAEYEDSGHVARAIALALAAQFIGNPFFSVFAALRRSAIGLRIQFAITVIPMTVLALAVVNGASLITAMHLYSVATALSIAIMVFLAFRLSKSIDNLSIAQKTI